MAKTAPGKFEGHAISYRAPLPDGCGSPVPVVPVFLNAYYPPNQPSPARCLALGEAIERAIDGFDPAIADWRSGVRRAQSFRGR